STSYGGSQSTRSYVVRSCATARNASWQRTVASRRSLSRFALIVRHASRSSSTKVHEAAPRDSASRPSAPEPANRSSTAAPSTGPTRLNAFSRTRSEVGRVSRPRGAAMRCPFRVPAMIRTPAPSRARRRVGGQTVGVVLPRTLLVAELGDDRARALDQVAVGAEPREAQVAPAGLPRPEQLALAAEVEVDLCH